MKIRFVILIIALLLNLPLFGEDDIYVKLSTDSPLKPIYLGNLSSKSSPFDKKYLQELKKVLQFDLNHNGSTKVISNQREKDEQIEKENNLKNFDLNNWKNWNLPFVLKAEVDNQILNVTLLITQNGNVKGIEGIPLTGNLSQDRKTIHQLSDTIHSILFGTKGIANSRILYTIRTQKGDNSEGWSTEVWESDYDGANAKQLTKDGYLCVTPNYVPPKAGLRAGNFLYVSYKIGQPKIYIASLKDGTGKRLSFVRGNQLMPVLSLQRDLLAFVSDAEGNPDLFIQPFSLEQGLIGKPKLLFSAPGGTQGTPTFSPDGKKIAFVSNKDGTARIYILPVPTIEQKLTESPVLISKQNRDNTSPAWSSDGKKIAYSASTKGVRQIWVYDVETKKETQLTQGSTHKENPAWAPNSTHLVFNSSTNNSAELYLINIHQKEAVKISHGPGEKRFPSVEP